ncbi:acetylcholine receptor subunit alpha-like [Mya arenaria]|uniref:acetylcholine receptor subunit alpha-like n=1 Tax=Mya arenaria TaxID=6604 RepID=UPI0022DFEE30|nr:acetylcholine receptor subunit alpha-like [Mya arenaria]
MKLTLELTIVFVFLIAPAQSQRYENATKLHEDLLTNYQPSVRPLNNQTDVLNVNVSLYLYSLLEVDSVKGVVTLVLSLFCSWYDERLTWNPADYDGINKMKFFQNEVWKPPMALSSPVEFTLMINSKTFATVAPNGWSWIHNGNVLESSCNFNMQFWPFDKQVCDVNFIPIDFDTTEVQLSVSDPGIILYTSSNSEWIIEKTKHFVINQYGTSESSFRFYLQRKSTFYILTIIVPIAGMTIASSLVFLLPNESGERVSFSITIMLALAVFQTVVADEMPKTSEPTAVICIFLLMGIIVSLVSMVIVILNMRLYHKSKSMPLGPWYTMFVRVMALQGCAGHCGKNRVEVDGNMMMADNEIVAEKNTKSFKFTGSKADKNSMTFEKPIENDSDNKNNFENVTWQDLSLAVDKVCFLVISIFTTVGSISCLVYMAAASTYVEF